MFDELIINAMPSLVKYFDLLKLRFYFTKPQVRHLQAIIVAMMLKGFSGKMIDVAEMSCHAHRTCIGRFLDSGGWNEEYLMQAVKKHVVNTIWQEARRMGKPVYIIIDDTIYEKAKPSSQVKSPIYGCGFYKSHLKNKMVYGQQFVSCMLRCEDLVLPYDIVLYEKSTDENDTARSKIGIACGIIKSLPSPPYGGYVVTDSWYSCQALFESSKSKGCHFIGALKSNRLIFPRGFCKKGIKIGKYVRSLKQSDFDFVTVGGHSYHVYTYLGKINGLRKVKIIITWPKGSFGIPAAMKAFISTDIQMNPKQLISHYMKRWPVEVFFREANRYFGMKQCQLRSKKAVIRYQYILMLGYVFCGMSVSGGKIILGKQRREHKKSIEKFKITWIFEQAKKNRDLHDIFARFKVV
ncbi:MAG: transposase [Leptospirales bacterium]|nr:transposase [Leptospirales bacterium]